MNLPPSRDWLLPISVSTLTPDLRVGIDFYLCGTSKEEPVLYCTSEESISGSTFARLSSAGVTTLYIRPEDRTAYQEYLRANWRGMFSDERLTLTHRMALMSEVTRDVLETQFANGTTDSIVNHCQELGADTARVFGNQAILVSEMGQVLHHDYGTFTHSANVAAYAVRLGRELGFSSGELEQLAAGALLHDIGKLEVSEKILNKPGKLDEAEWREMRLHPTKGLERIASRVDLSLGQFMMIYQHHERCDGSGYPVGCHKDEIHPFGKLCAIVDVFEALTSVRPYRAALGHGTALAVLNRGRGSEFDEDMLQCWQTLVLK